MGETNGRRNGEIWWRIAGLALAGLVAYFTAIGTLQSRVSVIDSREQQHFEEIQRTLQRIERSVERLEQRP